MMALEPRQLTARKNCPENTDDGRETLYPG